MPSHSIQERLSKEMRISWPDRMVVNHVWQLKKSGIREVSHKLNFVLHIREAHTQFKISPVHSPRLDEITSYN
jgi:hypothetical protein